jgi:hypothetical protein
VPSLALGFVTKLNTSATVHNRRLLHDQTITSELEHVATRVGQGNFVNLIGVHPDLALSALEDIGREALLELERNCNDNIK